MIALLAWTLIGAGLCRLAFVALVFAWAVRDGRISMGDDLL